MPTRPIVEEPSQVRGDDSRLANAGVGETMQSGSLGFGSESPPRAVRRELQLATAENWRKAADCGTLRHFRRQVAQVRHFVAKRGELRHSPNPQQPLSTNKHG